MLPFRNRFLRLFTNPFLLSVLPALALVMIFPPNHSRYLLELVSFEYLNERTWVFYEDLTGNGHSEKIMLSEDFNSNAMVIYDASGAALNQWNLHGGFGFVHQFCLHISGDYDGDGQKELYVFSLSNDSIYLHMLAGVDRPGWALKKRLLATVGPGRRGPDPHIIPADMEDLDGDGKKELLFGINTGFSLQPRNVFAYFIDRDSLASSPASFAQVRAIHQADLTGDGRREMVVSTYASANTDPLSDGYHDHSGWLMVLDHQLDFLFEPVEYPGRFRSVKTLSLRVDGQTVLAVLATRQEREPGVLQFIDATGRLIRQRPLEADPTDLKVIRPLDDDPVILLYLNNEGLAAYDKELHPLGRFRADGTLSHDRTSELFPGGETTVFASAVSETSTLHVYRDDLRHTVSAPIQWTEGRDPIISVIHRGKKRPLISLLTGRNHHLFDYRPNPVYYKGFLRYPAAYLGMLLFALLVVRQQKNRMRQERETEKKITELQLGMVRSRMDPHFQLNALNSVMHAAQEQRYDVVQQGLASFAGLYRSLLLSAGSVRRPLEEELQFTRDYLELETIRLDGRFSYTISVEPGVDPGTLVPNMIVQVHAENAIKHGLAPLKEGGRLEIRVRASGGDLLIEVLDNGVGRSRAGARSDPAALAQQSTGLGLEMMDELYVLYKKYYHQEISSYIRNLRPEMDGQAGTHVQVRIGPPVMGHRHRPVSGRMETP